MQNFDLKKTKSILFWNVDTQIDFMCSDGNLYVKNAEQIVPTLKKLTKFAKKHSIRVVNTCDYHNENSIELSDNPDFITTFPHHCMKNTIGQDFIKATKPKTATIFEWNKKYTSKEIKKKLTKNRNIIIRKDFFDVFHNSITEYIVKRLAPKKIFIYGVATNVCVDFAVKGLAERGYNVFVVEDAIKELPNIPTPFEIWERQGITLIRSEEIIGNM